MLKGLRLRIMLIAGLMLVFFGYSSFNEARAQCAGDSCLCDLSSVDPGWFELTVTIPDLASGKQASDFTAGLLGTVESLGAGQPNIGGLDWLFNDESNFNTNLPGSQIITWYSQAGRNSFVQVTNTNDEVGFCSDDPNLFCFVNTDCKSPATCVFKVNVHVQILDSTCKELFDYCDTYTVNDTHVYDLGDCKLNVDGSSCGANVPDGEEGIFILTPVDNCPDPNEGICYNHFIGNLRMIDDNDFDYGTNVYTREAVLQNTDETCDTEFTPVDGTEFEYQVITFPAGAEPDLAHHFSTVGVDAGADVVLMSLKDSYGPPYRTIAGSASYLVTIYDDAEKALSCGDFSACFARRGINLAIPNSDDFTPPTPTPSPTPTAGPPTATPTATATAEPPGGGGEGCSIAGSTVQLGTAMANILIPLVPALAIGYRVL